jgi:hypothetical protein
MQTVTYIVKMCDMDCVAIMGASIATTPFSKFFLEKHFAQKCVLERKGEQRVCNSVRGKPQRKYKY